MLCYNDNPYFYTQHLIYKTMNTENLVPINPQFFKDSNTGELYVTYGDGSSPVKVVLDMNLLVEVGRLNNALQGKKDEFQLIDAFKALNFSSVPANSWSGSLTIPCAAALEGDRQYSGKPANLPAGLIPDVTVIDGAVSVRLFNTTSAPIDPPSGTWRVTVAKPNDYVPM